MKPTFLITTWAAGGQMGHFNYFGNWSSLCVNVNSLLQLTTFVVCLWHQTIVIIIKKLLIKIEIKIVG